MTATVFPTGTTIYDTARCWSGFTVFQPREVGAILIDMNGNVVNRWRNLQGLPGPNKVLPGGFVMGSTGQRNPKYGFQDNLDLVQVTWDGEVVWRFNRQELVRDPRCKGTWMARQHHDYQRQGNPVGYFVPGMGPLVDRGNTLIVCHANLRNPAISDKLLLDDVIIEVTWDRETVWKWVCSEHFEEMGFREEARNVLSRNPGMLKAGGGMGDWMHLNSASLLGPNKWFESGDERFHPDNAIISGRETNILAIIEKKTGRLVWKLGPDYSAFHQRSAIGQVVGPHHVHMIPGGLPGEGNILVFDNGGWAGYGAPNPGSPAGRRNALRDYSRVVEFDPITFEIVWQYPERKGDGGFGSVGGTLYSPLMSSAQRLPNGNTLITEGNTGRIFEVTRECAVVWEYVNPYYGRKSKQNMIYRAYRVPYEWVPQAELPKEVDVPRMDNSRFRVPGAPPAKVLKVTDVKG
jgi:Arylsulfotransferase (ASST)